MTADERDRRIVMQAHSWATRPSNIFFGQWLSVAPSLAPLKGCEEHWRTKWNQGCKAAVRILNRIAREERKKAKKGKR